MSLLFYSWGEPVYIFLMLVSITVNYEFAITIDRYTCADKKHRKDISYRKAILIFAIVFNIGLLWFFKYFQTSVMWMNSLLGEEVIPVREVALPLGISFYTFQILSYVIDVYWCKCDVQKKWINLALYVCFFPQLIAGPIVKYKDIAGQITDRNISLLQTSVGIKRFIYGLAKKVIVANSVAEVADRIFSCPWESIDTVYLWIGVILYTLQIYYDFSGYSDMAIGLGKMFGFEFTENFNYPYISKSIQEFWRRWHISLSSWFKEYVYIPLGGNRHGNFKTYRNLLIVFIVTGVWHGATINYLVWGLYYGFFIIIERVFLGKWLEKNPVKFINHVYTLVIVSTGWAIFRCDSLKEALSLCSHLFTWQNEGLYCWYDFFSIRSLVIVVVAILLLGFVQEHFYKIKKFMLETERVYMLEFIGQMLLLAICTVLLISGQYNPFIYFKF